MKNKKCSGCAFSVMCLPLGLKEFADSCFQCTACKVLWATNNSRGGVNAMEKEIITLTVCSEFIAAITKVGVCKLCFEYFRTQDGRTVQDEKRV